MKTALMIGTAAALALSTAAPAAYAQYSPYHPQYQQEWRNYQDQRSEYEAARREYERRMADYERARAAYDARWGYGAYARAYGPPPVWDDRTWSGAYAYNPPYSPPYAYNPPYAGSYGRDAAYGAPVAVDCRRDQDRNAVAGGVIGALAGAVLGSNIAARNVRTEGAVLGAAVGSLIGVGVSRSTARCDDRGYYYSYNDTVPYREPAYAPRRGRYDSRYFTRMNCRLAPAPVDYDRDGYAEDYRYVRVCPDNSGRYRIVDDYGRFRYWG